MLVIMGVNVGFSHVAGTPLGDPIEVGALGTAISRGRKAQKEGLANDSEQMLALSSVKSCYGHTEGAAGLTGTLFALQELAMSCRPAVMNLRNTNPYIQAAFTDWMRTHKLTPSVPRSTAPSSFHMPSQRVVGTSSFGMSGVNAHALLTSAPSVGHVPPSLPFVWQRARIWPLAPPSALAPTATVKSVAKATFAISFPPSCRGFLHSVLLYGRYQFGLAGMLEIAAASLATMQFDSAAKASVTGLVACTMSSLPNLENYDATKQDSTTGGSPSFSCDIDGRTGSIAISSDSGEHFKGQVGNLLAGIVVDGNKAAGANRPESSRPVAYKSLRQICSPKQWYSPAQSHFSSLRADGPESRNQGLLVNPAALESLWQVLIAARSASALLPTACEGLLNARGGKPTEGIPAFVYGANIIDYPGTYRSNGAAIIGLHTGHGLSIRHITFRLGSLILHRAKLVSPPLMLEWKHIELEKPASRSTPLTWVFVSTSPFDINGIIQNDGSCAHCVNVVYSRACKADEAARDGNVVRCGPHTIDAVLSKERIDHLFIVSLTSSPSGA
jgi:Beta-ketoacyl synthase, C-terminal domain